MKVPKIAEYLGIIVISIAETPLWLYGIRDELILASSERLSNIHISQRLAFLLNASSDNERLLELLAQPRRSNSFVPISPHLHHINLLFLIHFLIIMVILEQHQHLFRIL